MKKFVILVLLISFLVACSQTQVQKIDQIPTTEEQAVPETQETVSSGAAVQTASGKSATSCDDPDLNDPESPGRVTVTYDDGTTEDFFDTCPTGMDGKIIGPYLTEYVCDGNVAKSKNVVCSYQCVMVGVKDPAAAGKKVGFCMGKMA